MGNFYNPVLTEEQMAAYLDGMLTTEENNMVEELISFSPEMKEIQEAVDAVDVSFIYNSDIEVPIECLADDFSLPDIPDVGDMGYVDDNISSDDEFEGMDDYQNENVDNCNYDTGSENEESFLDCDCNGIEF